MRMEVVEGDGDLMRPILGPKEPLVNVQCLNVFSVNDPVLLWGLANVVVGAGVDMGHFKAALGKAINRSKFRIIKGEGPPKRGDYFDRQRGYVYINVESAKEQKELKGTVYRKAITPLVTLTLWAECEEKGGGTWRTTSAMEKVCSLTAQRLEAMIELRLKKKCKVAGKVPRRRKKKKTTNQIAKRKAMEAAKKKRGCVRRKAGTSSTGSRTCLS